MILDGECGTFNPLLMECLKEMAGTLRQELDNNSQSGRIEMRSVAEIT